MSVLRQTLCFCVLLPGLVQGADFHVRAGSSGDGSVGDPFGTLEAAERASAPNDRIFLHAAPEPLAGSIALKPGQKLLRHGQDDVTLSNASTRRPIVRLARDTEVQGLGFVDLHAHAITGGEQAISGTVLHENHFSGSTSAESEDGIWAIRIDTSEDVEDFVATDNQVSDGVDLGGVQILQHGNSRGSYRFERNTFNDLGHRAHHFWSMDNARLEAEVLSSRADNIGLGDRNSDSILPHLSHRSEQKIVVRDYHYKNSDGVGNASNTGLEAFIMGAPSSS